MLPGGIVSKATVGEFLQMTIVANLAEDFVFASNDPTSSKGLCTETGDPATKDTHLPVSAPMMDSSSSCQFCKLPKGFRSQHKVHHHGKSRRQLQTPNYLHFV
jgi:hypothetical protein